MKSDLRRTILIFICWLVAHAIYIVSIGPANIFNTSFFDEGIYLYESLQLAKGIPASYFKGPVLYAVTAVLFKLSPSLLSARVVSILFDLALAYAFYYCLRAKDRDVAFYGAVFIAACPLNVFMGFHLLTDVPATLFSFLCFYFYCKDERLQSAVLSTLWFSAALLVKSTAIIMFVILLACAVVLRKSKRRYLLTCVIPAIVYILLPMVWPQHSDLGFLKVIPYMCFDCGVFYFFVALLVSAGPVLLFAALVPFFKRSLLADELFGSAAVSLIVLYAYFTIYGFVCHRFAMYFVPFTALLAGVTVKYWMPKRFFIPVLLLTMIWITPVAQLLETAGTGMTRISQYLKQFPQQVIFTTVPSGIHQHGFAGNLHFIAGKELQYIETNEIEQLAASSTDGIVIWTDHLPDALEQYLADKNISHHRIDFHNWEVYCPVYIIGMQQWPMPHRKTHWGRNILTNKFVTAVDLAIYHSKRTVYRTFKKYFCSE